ncbi:hypothetical protein TrLO_g13805 [Triparma laevis f. longispina]|uniref:Cilia- and flagella-associated protein 36 n=1 Tax=Triparma laevis f. longispina TaxID=1714387 RepID=A0A9W7FEF6_9STRA|nr:hypothetical protein TrLO_g13805 [Triparma laevis f. longispina]
MSGDEWIFESVAQILKSPAWEAEVYGFIDEHCVIFDNDDENKFAYTDLHKEFKGIVERHLNSKLAEFGIGEETFYEACESNRFKNDINKNVYMQMVAMDDFLTFKKLMVRRNMELELEAVKALQSASVPLSAPKSDDDAEAQFQAALKASEDMSPAERAALMQGAGESKDGGEGNGKGESEMEEQLKAAIQANMTEMELFHKQEEFEQLQLEQAIAASLAMHEDELREAKMEAKRIDSMDGAMDLGLMETGNSNRSMHEYESEPKKPAAVGSMMGESESESESEEEGSQEDTVNYGGTPAKATSPTFDEVNKNVDDEDDRDDDGKGNLSRVIDAAQAKVLEDNVVDAKAVETPKKKTPIKSDDKEVQMAEPVMEAEIMTGQVVDDEEPVKVVKKKKKEKKEKKEKKKKKKREKEDFKLEDGPISLNKMKPLPVLGGIEPGRKTFVDSPVKPLSELQDEMVSRKKQAEEAFRKNHEMLNEQRRQQEEMRKAAQLTEADIASRAMHLKRQRELIVAKKKAEREKAANNARAQEKADAEQFKHKIANFSGGDGGGKSKREDESGAKGETNNSEDLSANDRRASMRIALAARMKRDMLIAEEERLTKLQSDQFAELDEKLKKVEELREENRMREDDLKEAIRQNQNLRALNIHRSGINNQQEFS